MHLYHFLGRDKRIVLKRGQKQPFWGCFWRFLGRNSASLGPIDTPQVREVVLNTFRTFSAPLRPKYFSNVEKRARARFFSAKCILGCKGAEKVRNVFRTTSPTWGVRFGPKLAELHPKNMLNQPQKRLFLAPFQLK